MTFDAPAAARTLLKLDASATLETKALEGGATGKSFLVEYAGTKYVLRFLDSDSWTPGGDLKKATAAVAAAGIGANVIASDETALLVEFKSGRNFSLAPDLLLGEGMKGETMIPLFASSVAKFHQLDCEALSCDHVPKGWDELQKWVDAAVSALKSGGGGEAADVIASNLQTALNTFAPYCGYGAGHGSEHSTLLAADDSALGGVRASHGDLHFRNFLVTESNEVTVVDLDRIAPRRIALDLAYLFLLWGDEHVATGRFAFPPKPEGHAMPYASLESRRLFAQQYLAAFPDLASAGVSVDDLLLEVEACTFVERLRMYCIYVILSGGNMASPLISMAVGPAVTPDRQAAGLKLLKKFESAKKEGEGEFLNEVLSVGLSVMVANDARAAMMAALAKK